MAIKNIVFDIGNVLVEWQPVKIVQSMFYTGQDNADNKADELARKIFKSETWYDLNKGKLTLDAATKIYSELLGIPLRDINQLLDVMKKSLQLIPGSIALLNQLKASGYALYSITDNVKEIIVYLRATYSFFDEFIDIIVSANLGVLKPDPIIYQHLLNKYNLVPHETLFIDDVLVNIEGAKKLGMAGVQFLDPASCKAGLIQHGVKL